MLSGEATMQSYLHPVPPVRDSLQGLLICFLDWCHVDIPATRQSLSMHGSLQELLLNQITKFDYCWQSSVDIVALVEVAMLVNCTGSQPQSANAETQRMACFHKGFILRGLPRTILEFEQYAFSAESSVK